MLFRTAATITTSLPHALLAAYPPFCPAICLELLLTADEAAAILSDAETRQRPADTVTATEGRAHESGGPASTDKEEECRRETEALAVLLSDPGGGSGGASSDGPGGAAAQSALTRLAARYLVRETVRGKIPDPVGNFHVRV